MTWDDLTEEQKVELGRSKPRDRLPDRRATSVVEVGHTWRTPHGDFPEDMLVTIGRHDDGRIGEVFIDYPPRLGEKQKSERVMALGDDIAVLISIALQYGAPLDVLRHAVGREDVNLMGTTRSMPATIVGAVLDAVAAEAAP